MRETTRVKRVISVSLPPDVQEALDVFVRQRESTISPAVVELIRVALSSNPIGEVQRDEIRRKSTEVRIFMVKRLQNFMSELVQEIARGVELLEAGEQWPPQE